MAQLRAALLLGSALVLAFSGRGNPAAADSFLIDAVVNATNGGFIIDGDDTLTVTEDGIIDVNGVHGLGLLGDGNRIDILGSVATSGAFSDGVFFDSATNTTVTVSGSIETDGPGAHAFHLNGGNANVVTLRGAATTKQNASPGIFILGGDNHRIAIEGTMLTQDDASIGAFSSSGTNHFISVSGELLTQGQAASGLVVAGGTGHMVSVSGIVQTQGTSADGIISFNNSAAIDISGTVETLGLSSSGLILMGVTDHATTISGKVHTVGPSSFGLFLGTADNSTVTICGGEVVSDQSLAIFVPDTNSGHTINLCSSSFFYGGLDMSDSEVNITVGAAPSVLWDLSGTTSTPNVTGPGSWFFNPDASQFATFDNTGFAGNANWIGALTGQLGDLISRRDTGARQVGATSAMIEPVSAGGPTRAFSPTGLADTGMTAWAAGFGAAQNYKQDGASLEHRAHDWGFAFGGDMAADDNLSVGFMGGYVNGGIKAEGQRTSSQDNEVQGGFGAIYARKDFFHGLFAGFGLIGGGLAHDDKRFINTNNANMGMSYANADYTSWFLSPGVRLGADIDALAPGVTFTPSGQFRYTAQWVDGYTESGAGEANARVGARTVSLGEVSGELAMSSGFDFGAMLTGRVTGRAGYVHRFNIGDNNTNVTVFGSTQPVVSDASDSGWAYAGGGVLWNLTRQLDLEVNADATFGNDLSDTGVVGTAMLGWKL